MWVGSGTWMPRWECCAAGSASPLWCLRRAAAGGAAAPAAAGGATGDASRQGSGEVGLCGDQAAGDNSAEWEGESC